VESLPRTCDEHRSPRKPWPHWYEVRTTRALGCVGGACRFSTTPPTQERSPRSRPCWKTTCPASDVRRLTLSDASHASRSGTARCPRGSQRSLPISPQRIQTRRSAAKQPSRSRSESAYSCRSRAPMFCIGARTGGSRPQRALRAGVGLRGHGTREACLGGTGTVLDRRIGRVDGHQEAPVVSLRARRTRRCAGSDWFARPA
jgi:hypothetical protein